METKVSKTLGVMLLIISMPVIMIIQMINWFISLAQSVNSKETFDSVFRTNSKYLEGIFYMIKWDDT